MPEPVREAVSHEARHVEREIRLSAIAQRMAANAWGWILYVAGVPTAALVEEGNRADEESPHVATLVYKRARKRSEARGQS